jgi:hypothetical protein
VLYIKVPGWDCRNLHAAMHQLCHDVDCLVVLSLIRHVLEMISLPTSHVFAFQGRIGAGAGQEAAMAAGSGRQAVW